MRCLPIVHITEYSKDKMDLDKHVNHCRDVYRRDRVAKKMKLKSFHCKNLQINTRLKKVGLSAWFDKAKTAAHSTRCAGQMQHKDSTCIDVSPCIDGSTDNACSEAVTSSIKWRNSSTKTAT